MRNATNIPFVILSLPYAYAQTVAVHKRISFPRRGLSELVDKIGGSKCCVP